MSDKDVRQRVQLEFFDFLNRASKEGVLLLFLGGCVYLLMALVSFDARDPGWSHLGYAGKVYNLGGRAGAWVADISLSFVGYMAYLLPILLSYRALLFFRKRDESLLMRLPFIALRTLGAAILLVSGTALASLHFSSQFMSLPFSAGGLMGSAIVDAMVPLFDIVGSSLMLICAFLLGLSLLTNLSWAHLADLVGSWVLGLWALLVDALQPAPAALSSASDPLTKSAPGTDRQPVLASRKQSAVTPAEKQVALKVPALKKGDPADKEGDLSADAPALEPLSPLKDKAKAVQRVLQSTFSNRNEEVRGKAERLEPSLDALNRGAVDEPEFGNLGSALDEPPFEPDPVTPAATQSGTSAKISDARASEPAPVVASTSRSSAVPADRHLKIVPLSQTLQPVREEGDPNESATDAPLDKPALSALPALDVLDRPEPKGESSFDAETLEQLSRLLEAKLKDFGVVAEVVEVNPGPVITRFEIQPAAGVKVSKITNLAKDLARSMTVRSVRVVEVIAGKSTVGIEIPNQQREMVRLREVLGSAAYQGAEARLSLGLGNDIAGNPVVVNLAKMPHLLVAGTTGSGKSVGVNGMILSLLFKATPQDVRLIMVDPKMLELSIYDGIPHLLTPVITDMKEAASGLRWCVGEMERRYRLMAAMGVRNLAGFNAKVREAKAQGKPLRDPLWKPEQEGVDLGTPAPELEKLPYIVVVIDEFADMMMIVGKKVEELIARIAQKARAAGIHLVLATQRPSVDVITGLIKANIPTRIAFQVSSKIDSRTILDQGGAEHLLGNGDMLYQPAGTNMPIRVHGAFVADDEVHRVVDEWKKRGTPEFIEEIVSGGGDSEAGGAGGGGLFEDEQDPLYDQAVDFVIRSRRASISSVQRKLKIGYNRAARLVETMEAAGVVSEAAHNGTREVLVPEPAE